MQVEQAQMKDRCTVCKREVPVYSLENRKAQKYCDTCGCETVWKLLRKKSYAEANTATPEPTASTAPTSEGQPTATPTMVAPTNRQSRGTPYPHPAPAPAPPVPQDLRIICLTCHSTDKYQQLPGLKFEANRYCLACNKNTSWELYDHNQVKFSEPTATTKLDEKSDATDTYKPLPIHEDQQPVLSWKYSALGIVAGVALGSAAGYLIGKAIFGTTHIVYTTVGGATKGSAVQVASTATTAALNSASRNATATAVATLATMPSSTAVAHATAAVGNVATPAAVEGAIASLASYPGLASPVVAATLVEGVGVGSVMVGASIGGGFGAATGSIVDQKVYQTER
eukprot:PhF_6_TR38141/c0_g1_i2/m.56968